MSDQDEPMIDFGGLMSQLGQMQENLREAQQAAAAQVVEGSAGGGAVKVKVSGNMTFSDVRIEPSIVDPADVEMLQDLVLAAIRDAVEKVHQATTSALTGGLNLDALGGLGLGGLLGGELDQG